MTAVTIDYDYGYGENNYDTYADSVRAYGRLSDRLARQLLAEHGATIEDIYDSDDNLTADVDGYWSANALIDWLGY